MTPRTLVRIAALALLWLAIAPFHAHASAPLLGAQTWFVDAGACPGPGTGSQGDPLCSIQDAIAAAQDGDTVLVRPGTYAELLNLLGKNIVLRSDLDGDPATHDPAPDLTIVDGGGGGPVVDFSGSAYTPDMLLEGFTVQNGTTNGSGAGVRISFGSPTIRGNVIQDNTTSANGAGIYVSSSSATLIEGNTIRNNVANGQGASAGGGGIWLSFSDGCVIRGNAISENSARHGGGISNLDSNQVVTIEENIIVDNFASDFGGGVNTRGRTDILRNVIADNLANTFGGGGIMIYVGQVVVADNLLAANTATGLFGFGGACLIDSVSGPNESLLLANTIVDNLAGGAGGAINVTANGHAKVIGCVLRRNFSSDGHTAYVNGGSTLDFAYSDLDMQPADLGGPGTYSLGAGLIDADPMFVDPLGADGVAMTWEDNDYRLEQTSPCIDAGDNSLFLPKYAPDLDGKERFCDVQSVIDSGAGPAPVVDMGAYEARGLGCAEEGIGCGFNPEGSLSLVDGSPGLGDTLTFELHDPTGSFTPSTPSFLIGSDQPSAPFPPCGLLVPGWGLAAPGTPGELFVSFVRPNPELIQQGPLWLGAPVSIPVPVPNDPLLIGKTFYVQGLLLDLSTGRIAITEGVALPIGP